MNHLRRMSQLAVLLLSVVGSLQAQTATDPSGHWEGAIQAPGKDVKIEIDLAKKDGKLAGTFGNPEQHESGFPLSDVSAQGASISFTLKATNGGGKFQGALSEDGKSMSGDFITAHGMSIGFSLTRTGEAKIEALLPSPSVAKELEGNWTGTLEAAGVKHQIGLKMLNHPDGTATGIVVSSEGVEIPITRIKADGSSLTLDVKNVGGSYTGKLDAGGTELVGTWTQGAFVGAVTFRREK